MGKSDKKRMHEVGGNVDGHNVNAEQGQMQETSARNIHSMRPRQPLPPPNGYAPPLPPPQPPMPSEYDPYRGMNRHQGPSPQLQQEVVAFIEEYRYAQSMDGPPTAITLESAVQAICRHFRVSSFEELMGWDPLSLPALKQLHQTVQRLWMFITSYAHTHPLHTIRECHEQFLREENIDDFIRLQIGNSFVATDAAKRFYGHLYRMPQTRTKDVLSALTRFDHLEQQNEFRPRQGHGLDYNAFLQFLAEQHQQRSIADMGVYFDPAGFGKYVRLVKKLSKHESREMGKLDADFMKGIEQKVFEVTKNRFTIENRERALEEFLHNGPTDGSKGKTAVSGVSLSVQVLRRVTEVDVFLDNILYRRHSSKTTDRGPTKQKAISSAEISSADSKLRNLLAPFVQRTQNSKNFSRIKVITWVLCGLLAKAHAVLMHSDQVPDSHGDVKGEGGTKEVDFDEEECDCCCVGEDSCQCDCKCECHVLSDDSEEEEEQEQEGEVKEEIDQEQLKQEMEEYLNEESNMLGLNTPDGLLSWLIGLHTRLEKKFGDGKWRKLVLPFMQETLQSKGEENEWVKLLTKNLETVEKQTMPSAEAAAFVRQLQEQEGFEKMDIKTLQQRLLAQFGSAWYDGLSESELQDVMETASNDTEASSITKYSTILTDSGKNSDSAVLADEGEWTGERARAALAQVPFLVDVAEHVEWGKAFASTCGPLKPFLASQMSGTFRFVQCRNGSVIRVNAESTPSSLQLLPKNATGWNVATELVSVYVNCGGEQQFPKELVQMHVKELAQRVEEPQRMLLEALIYAPLDFASMVYNVLDSAIEGDGTDAKLAEACSTETERSRLRLLGAHLSISAWIKLQATAPKPVMQVPSSHQKEPEVSSDTEEEDVQMQEPSVEVDAASTEDPEGFIKGLRKHQFGIGLETADEATKNVLEIQRHRLQRALKRLSDELYSDDTHFVLELLQNADDNVYPSGVTPTALFSLRKDGKLVFHNNERGFSEDNVRAICDVGASTKTDNGAIGRKGIGFKSVFKLSDAPEVHSNGFHLRFDAQRDDGLGYILPHWVGNDQWTGAGTTLVLPLRKAIRLDSVAKSLGHWDASILLFLRKVLVLELEDKVNNTRLRFQKQVEQSGKYESVLKLSSSGLERRWLMVNDKLHPPVSFKRKSTQISIALPLHTLDDDTVPDLQQVFAFLPLRSYGLRFVLHADFDVVSSREAVVEGSDWNQWLVSKFPSLFATAVQSYLKVEGATSDSVAYLLSLLPRPTEVQSPFRGVVQDMLRHLRQLPLLLAANGDLVKPTDILDAGDTSLDLDQELVVQATGKSALDGVLANRMDAVMKAELGVERLSASHVLKMLATSKTDNKVALLSAFTTLYKRSSSKDLLLQELSYLPVFAVSVDKQKKWVSFMSCKRQLFLPGTKVSSSLQEWLAGGSDMFVAESEFANQIEEEVELKKLLVDDLKVNVLDDHGIITSQVLPALGETVAGVQVLAKHLSDCRNCPLRESMKVALDRVFVKKNTFVVLPSTRQKLTQLMDWVDDNKICQITPSAANSVETKDSDWQKTLVDLCRLPVLLALDDAQSAPGITMVLKALEKEEDATIREQLSLELASFFNSSSSSLNDTVGDTCRQHKWLLASDSGLYKPTELWAENAKKVFEPYMVPFCAYSWTSEQMVAALGLRKEPRASDVLVVLKQLSDVKTNVLELEHIFKLYKFLQDEQDSTEEVYEAFVAEPLLYLPTKHSFVTSNDVVWSGGADLPFVNALKSMYPSSLRSFFTDMLKVPKRPSIELVMKTLSKVKATTRSSWDGKVLPLLRALSKSMKSNLLPKKEAKELRRKLQGQKTKWLPVLQIYTDGGWKKSIQHYDSGMAFRNSKAEKKVVKLMTSIWEESHRGNEMITVVDLPNDADLEPLLELMEFSDVSSRIMADAPKWINGLELMCQNAPNKEKMEKLVGEVVKLWAKMWSAKDEQGPEHALANAAIFPVAVADGSRRFLIPMECYVDDQRELSAGEVKGARVDGSMDLPLLSLFSKEVLEAKQSLHEFLVSICGVRSLRKELHARVKRDQNRREIPPPLAFDSKIRMSLHLMQRVMRHLHKQTYDHLDHDAIATLFAQLQVSVLEGPEPLSLSHDLVQSSANGHVVHALTIPHGEGKNCFLDRQQGTLYVTERVALEDGSSFLDVVMELSNKVVGALAAPTVTNVLYLASLQPEPELRERWLSDIQKISPMELEAEEVEWMKEQTETASRKRSHSVMLEDGEVEDEGNNKAFKTGSDIRPQMPEPPTRSFNPMEAIPPAYERGLSMLPPTGMNTMSDEEKKAIGRWGEQYVYEQLSSTLASQPEMEVEWVNADAESGLPYDILVWRNGSIAEYAEVKATRTSEKNLFEISWNELELAQTSGADYVIYRVYSAGDPSRCRVVKLKNPLALIKQRQAQLAFVLQ